MWTQFLSLSEGLMIFQLFWPHVSDHLMYMSSLISMFAVCTDAKYLEYTNNFCDNMELQMA